ncbi:YdcF-like protein [Burkholderiales bacterium GJ-E10]|nr:YdcF-like protein [Burkholderiales bacterium GJ-E10]
MQSDWVIALRESAHVFLVPPGPLLLLLVAGLLLLRRKPKAGRALLWTGTLLFLALSLAPVSRALTDLAGDYRPLRLADARAAQAIVVLAGEARSAPEDRIWAPDPGKPEPFEDTVGDLTLTRLRYGVLLAKRTGLPMLFTGGEGGLHHRALAELMQQRAIGDYGVGAHWLETRSRNTRENAQLSAPILRAAGVRTIVLVTDDNHMRRALREFAATGLRAIPAPVRIPSPIFSGRWSKNLRPGFGAFCSSSLAIYELLGQAAQILSPPPDRAR